MDVIIPKKRHHRVEIKSKTLSYNAFSDWGVIKHGV
jgi:hypothetical protein